MKPETFTLVAKVSELIGLRPFALSANGADVVLLRAGGSWRAFDGRCPHQGALLGEGELEDGAHGRHRADDPQPRSDPRAGRVRAKHQARHRSNRSSNLL